MTELRDAVSGIADCDAGLARFMGNEAMYRRFLLKFIDDESYGRLVGAMEAGDAKAAFEAAHTLKGTSATLELTAVAQAVEPLVELLRAGDVEAARGAMSPLEAAYSEAVFVLKGLE